MCRLRLRPCALTAPPRAEQHTPAEHSALTPSMQSLQVSGHPQAQSVSPPQGQPESQGYPSFQPPAFAAPQYSLQGYGAENVVPDRPPQQPQQQQQQQQQPQLQPQMMQPQLLQQPQQQQPQPGASVDGMSQRGSAGSLQELRQSASVPGE